MSYFKKIGLLLGTTLMLVSCFNKNAPNYQYFPNMYEPIGYETYQKSDAFKSGFEAQLPAENTIKRGWMPYKYDNTVEGKDLATLELLSPLDSLNVEKNLKVGKELYGIYCGVCHGDKGKGQGILVEREKILGVPSYADPARNITQGDTYHVIFYGLNSMGSYANQLDEKERWQVALHVNKLREKLLK